MVSPRKRHICIVGAGFGGIVAAHVLRLLAYRVTLIDAAPQFEFLPNIHEIISGRKRPGQVAVDREVLAKRLGCTFICARVTRIADGSLQLENGECLAFDACLVSIGCASNAALVPGASEHAFPVKTAADAERIYQRIAQAREQGGKFTISVIGGGIEGLEVLGELLSAYRNEPGFEFNLVSSTDTLLADYASGVHGSLRKHMDNEAVNFYAGARAAEIGADHILLASQERLHSDLTIWCAGVRAYGLAKSSGLAESKGWVSANQYLQSPTPSIFSVGDCVGIDHPNIEKTAGYAIDMALIAAWNMHQHLQGRPHRMRAFTPRQRPLVMAYGDLDTYLFWNDISVASRLLALVKEGIFNAGLTFLRISADRQELTATAQMLGRSFVAVYADALHLPRLVSRLSASRVYL